MKTTRRQLLAAGATLLAGCAATPKSAAPAAGNHFTLTRRNGRSWLLDPAGQPFFALGLNHIDSSPLRYGESAAIWRDKYANSMERWIKQAVRPDLLAWKFNSVGWVQEVVVRGPSIHRHSPSFTFEEYQWLDLPYCHLLPFAETHQWDSETRHPDFFGGDFEEWCDYVARAQCARMADDPKLIGYFYVDCPTWIHIRPDNQWKGPLFDPKKLQTAAGRDELFKLATRYYQVTHDAIRRYDKNHLIFGDRYEARAPLSEEVLRAAKPFVDVLSFQHFGKPDQIRADFDRWGKLMDMPILLADGCGQTQRSDGNKYQDGQWYADTLAVLRENPRCVGLHLCGAYVRNKARKRGLRDELERPDTAALAAITAANQQTLQWVQAARR